MKVIAEECQEVRVVTYPLQLPTGLVVPPIMQELAAIAIRAESRLFVVFAYVGLVVYPDGCPHELRDPLGSMYWNFVFPTKALYRDKCMSFTLII